MNKEFLKIVTIFIVFQLLFIGLKYYTKPSEDFPWVVALVPFGVFLLLVFILLLITLFTKIHPHDDDVDQV